MTISNFDTSKSLDFMKGKILTLSFWHAPWPTFILTKLHLTVVLLSGFLAISSKSMLSRSNRNADCSLRTPDNTKEQTSSFDSAVPQVVVDTPARLGFSNAKHNDESIDQPTTTVDTVKVNNAYTASFDNNPLTDLHRLTSAIYDNSPETSVHTTSVQHELFIVSSPADTQIGF